VHRALAIPAAALVAALALAAAGCGDDGGRSAEDWATDVCTELDTWADSIATSISGVMSQGLGVTRDDLSAAAHQASRATSELVDDLQEIEPPDTESGERAQEELQQLGDSLEQHAGEVRELVEGASTSGTGLADLGRSIVGEIGAAVDDTQAALRALQDAGDELRSGISDSDACTRLRERDVAVG
jgi:ABC-type transporter Mla subunit MlaD